MSLPSNAVLMAVKRPGPMKPNGDPGALEAVWSGAARGYLRREDRLSVRDGREVPVKVDVFTLPARLVPGGLRSGPDWEGSTITVLDRRVRPAATLTFRVEGAQLAAAGTPVDTLRLELEEA